MSADAKMEILLTARDVSAHAFNTIQGHVRSLTSSVLSLNYSMAGIAAAAAGIGLVAKGINGAFGAVEEFNLGTASLAATIATFTDMKGKDMVDVYRQSYEYAEQLNYKMEEWNVKTIASGANIRAMVETMAQAGVVLDINNKKQEQGVIAIANALAIVTQGQDADKQFRQEIRGLIDGEAKATNRLATMIDNLVGGSLKDQVEKWRESGTLIENLGVMLTGFSAATDDLQNTWLAVGTTIETIYSRTLRGMFVPVYKDIIDLSKGVALSMLEQEKTGSSLTNVLKTGVYRAWIDIKNASSMAMKTVAAFEVPLKFMATTLGLALDGWGQILAVIEPVYARIASMVGAMWKIVEATANYGKMLYMFVTGRFQSAWSAWEDTKGSWNEAGKKTGQALASGLIDEIEAGIREYNKRLDGLSMTKDVAAPAMRKVTPKAKDRTAKEIKEEENRVKASLESFFGGMDEVSRNLADKHKGDESETNREYNKLKSRLKLEYQTRINAVENFQQDYKQATLSSFDFERELLKAQYDEYNKYVTDKRALNEWYTAESKRIYKDQTQEIRDLTSSVMAAGFKGDLNSMADAFGSFANSILRKWTDTMADMVVDQNWKEILSGTGGAVTGFFSSAAGFVGGLFHDGGIVGRDSAPSRTVPSSTFAGAPRLHNGLVPGEFAAILKDDEGVFTPEQMKALGGKSQSVNIQMNVENNTGTPVTATTTQKWDGEKYIIGVVLDAINRNGNFQRNFAGALGKVR